MSIQTIPVPSKHGLFPDLNAYYYDASDRASFVALRSMGLGGSDASVIVGANKYKQPFTLWLEKRAQSAGAPGRGRCADVGRHAPAR